MRRGLAALAFAGALSCGGDTGPGDGGPASLTLDPDGLTLMVGGQGSLTADLRDAANVVLPTTGVQWSSLNGLVASVGGSGLVTGVSVGSTRVIAADGEQADTVDVLVIDGLTLEVVPAAATVQVGGSQQFSVIARNGAGQVIAVPPALWTSGNPAVGMVVGGLAVGVGAGTAPITATVGSVTSPPALLTVNAASLACDDIGMTPGWDVTLSYSYAAALTNGDGHQLSVSHSGDFTATLAPVGGVLPAVQWEGSLAGTASINDRDTDLDSDPLVVVTLVGNGAPTTGMARSVFRLSVDTETCSFEFAASPFLFMTLTTTGSSTTVEQGDLAVGTLTATDPLGAWRTLGIAGFDESFDAHFIIAADRAGKNTYYPFGVGQLLWSNHGSPDAPEGAATVDYTIVPK